MRQTSVGKGPIQESSLLNMESRFECSMDGIVGDRHHGE